MSAAQTIQKFLHMHHVPYEIVCHPLALTSLKAASAANIRTDRLVKGVVLEDKNGYMLVAIPASRHLKLGKLRQDTGRDLHMAPEDELPSLFPDCVLGAIPAIGTAYGVETVWDESLMEQPDVYFEAGDHEHLMHIKTEHFIDLLCGAQHGRFSSSV